jgi:hypothetical protein
MGRDNSRTTVVYWRKKLGSELMALNEITCDSEWFILDLKQRVELCGQAITDFQPDFFESQEAFEAELRKAQLTWTADPGNFRYIVWPLGEDPPEGWPRARKDKVCPPPVIP